MKRKRVWVFLLALLVVLTIAVGVIASIGSDSSSHDAEPPKKPAVLSAEIDRPAPGGSISALGTPNHPTSTTSTTEPGTPTTSPGTVAMSGDLSGLYPGASLPLRLTLANPNRVAISVTRIVIAVTDASPGCPAGYLDVSGFGVPFTLLDHATGSTIGQVTLAADAPDACQSAAFSLAYSLVAVPA